MNYQHMKNQMVPDETVMVNLGKKLKKKPGVKTLKWAGAVAACLVLSLTVLNLTVPSFAESLPFFGGIFESINNRTGEKYKEPFINEKQAENADVINKKASENEADPVSLTLSELYCDGLNVSYSFTCERPESWKDITFGNFDVAKITVNGRDCTDNIMLLPRFEYANEHFEGSGHFNLYKSFGFDEIPDNLNVELVLSDMKPADTLTFDEEQSLALRSKWTFNFSVRVNKADTEYLRENEEHDGWVLAEIANAPSVAIVKIRAPEDVNIDNYFEKHDLFLRVYDAEGSEVESYGGGIAENADGTVTWLFETRCIETGLHGTKIILTDKIKGEPVTITDYFIK